MKVQLKSGWSKTYPMLTVGNVYRVLGIEADDLRIISDAGEPILFNWRAFRFVDPTHPPDWIVSVGDEGETCAYPPQLNSIGFFEDFFDGDEQVRSRFDAYMGKLCWDESALTDDPVNTYVRMQRSAVNPDDPMATYSELDEERWEVRRIELFANGRIGYANGTGSFNCRPLANSPLPPLDDASSGSGVHLAEVSREEFETNWERALAFEESSDNSQRAL